MNHQLNLHSASVVRAAAFVGLLAVLAGCGAALPVASLQNPAPSAAQQNFQRVVQAIERYDDPNLAVLIGDASGILFEYKKGEFPVTQQRAVGSASKWLTSATLMRLVEKGTLRLSDHPQAHLSYWTSDPADPRSQITLEQLLSFTSGFNADPSTGGCTNDPQTTLQACAQHIYQSGLETAPGTAFSYGPAHLHIAAAMAERATGKAFNDLFQKNVAGPLGMSGASRYVMPSLSNPLVSGGAASTARDYALFLQGILSGSLIANRAAFLQDRTGNVPFLFRPSDQWGTGAWHYALGAWLECDAPSFGPSCAEARIYSSPGSFGWTPWIDFKQGYFAIIARRGERFSTPIGVRLAQLLQPLIEEALAK